MSAKKSGCRLSLASSAACRHRLTSAAPARGFSGCAGGSAAKRLAISTGREARTIHRLLAADPASGGFRRHEEHGLACDLPVVGVPLTHALLKPVPDAAALLLVGDVDQLP